MNRRVSLLSIVIPCHNEEPVLKATHGRLSAILNGLAAKGRISDYELVFVDNGSTDRTIDELEGLFSADRHVRVIALRKNFGYQGSISAGLHHAAGDAAVTIDADLQDPPEKIEEMLGHYEQGYDLVLGVREDRSTDSFFKRVSSERYYSLLKLMGVPIVYNHGDFRLMARCLVDEFKHLPERNRFIRAMLLQLESRYALVPYKREPRTAGESKFRPAALFSLGLDGIISFSHVPLRIASIAGLSLCILSMAGVVWVLYEKLSYNIFPGWASTLLPILALGGFQLLMLGLIGEYIGRLYIEVKQRPLFVVRKELAHEKEDRLRK